MCKACEEAKTRKHSGLYAMKCFACRERLLLDEPCKLMRKSLVDKLEKWGEVPNWKQEPNCGCQYSCKRRQLTR